MLVAHDGARWLSDVARALDGQTWPVDRIVAVDTGSRDRSGTLLTRLFGNAAVFGAERATGFGAAVAQALRHRAANVRVPGNPAANARLSSTAPTVEWAWLLHDDCAPEPDALERLLEAADRAPHAAVLGPKVRDWQDRRIILEAGISIDGSGRRETGLEPSELDQGQHDGERDVLAVSTAGMLVRRDVWDRLGGFERSMAFFREDIDYCWRVVAAGYHVRLVTDAVVYHLAAAANGYRQVAGRPRRLDRRNALFVLLANLPLHAMLLAAARNTVGSLLRTLILLCGKQPAAAWDELMALVSVICDPLGLLRARRRRAPGRRRVYPLVRSFIPRGQTVGRFTEIVASALAGSQQPGAPADEEEALLTDSGLAQRIMTHPGVLTVAALAVIALVAERSLLHGGWLGGGALVPVSGGAAGLWREYLAGYHDVGIGSAANTPPYVAILAIVSTFTAGKPWLAVDVLLLGCVPLAGATAYLASRRITAYTPARMWAACAYALTPVATGAVAAGRIGTAVAFALLPVIGVLAARMLSLRGRRGRQSAWATGFVVAVMAAFVPLVWALSVAVAVLAYLAFGRGRPQAAVNLGIVAVVPGVLLLPWTLDLVMHPALFLLEAGLPRPGLTSSALPASALLLLRPGGPGMPPVWVTAGIGVAGLAALLLRGRRVLVAAGWAVALAGLLVAITVSRVKVAPPAGGPAMPGWPGVALSFAAAGLVLAAVAVAKPLVAMLHAGRLGRIGAAAVAVAACSAPALVAGYWVVFGAGGPLAGTGSSVLPAFVTTSAANGLRLRTLVLRSGPDGLRYSLLRNADPLIGELELAQPGRATQALDRVVAGLATGNGGELGDDGAALSQFAIGYVLVETPVDPGFVRVLDGTPGLQPVSLTESFGLWQVTGAAARVRVLEPGGNVALVGGGRIEVAGARAPVAGGTLVLAEPADGGWHASLNGRALTALRSPAGGWAQGFDLPAGGGRLDITRSMVVRQAALGVEAVAVVVAGILALPSAGPDETPRRRSRRKKPAASRGAPREPRPGPAARPPQPVPPAREPARYPPDAAGRWR